MKFKAFLQKTYIAIFIPIVLIAQTSNDDGLGPEPPYDADIIFYYLEHGAKSFKTKDKCWEVEFDLLYKTLSTDWAWIGYDVTITKTCLQSKYLSTYKKKLMINTYSGFEIVCRSYKSAPYDIGNIVSYSGKEFKIADIKFCNVCESDWSLILSKIHPDTSIYSIESEYHDSGHVDRKETMHDPAIEIFRQGDNDKDIKVDNQWYHIIGDSCLSNSPKFYVDKVIDWRYKAGGGFTAICFYENDTYAEFSGIFDIDISFDGIDWFHLVGEYCNGGLPFKKPAVKDLWGK